MSIKFSGSLKNIQEIEVFKKLLLVGGTSLALQIGHRTSIDLDLFGEINRFFIKVCGYSTIWITFTSKK
jgi:hypothetical protein